MAVGPSLLRRGATPSGVKAGAPASGAPPAVGDRYAHARVWYSRRRKGAQSKADTSCAAVSSSSLGQGRGKGGKGITAPRSAGGDADARTLRHRKSPRATTGDDVYVAGGRGGDRGRRGKGKALPPSSLSVRAARKKKRAGTAGCGAGSTGHMGRARSSRTRHATKPSIGTYNMGGGSRNRWDVVKDQYNKVDVLALQEISSSQGGWKGEEFAAEDHGRLLVGDKPPKGDPSGSAALRLSARMRKAVVDGSSGCLGSRIVYTRLSLGVQYLFVVSVYVPYWNRGCSNKGHSYAGTEACTTYRQLQTVLDSKSKPGDAIIVLTDANAKLAPTHDRAVGRFCVQQKPNEAGIELLHFMHRNELVAANTLFKPRRRQRRLRRHRTAHLGNVTYRPYNQNQSASQIDYILVSRRWLSSVEHTRVYWGASLKLQSAFRVDHGAVLMRWKERVKVITPRPPKQDPRSHDDPVVALRATNAGRLAAGLHPITPLQLERQMKKPCVKLWSVQQTEFGADVEAFGSAEYMQLATDLAAPILPPPPEEDCDPPTADDSRQQQAEINELYATLCEVCKATWAELEPMPKRKWAARTFTDRTRALLEERRRAIESGADLASDWPTRRKAFAKAIRDSCMKDWKEWVGARADDLTSAAAVGDAAGAAEIVRALGGKKPSFSCKAPTRAPKRTTQPNGTIKTEWGKGDELTAESLAQTWRDFAAEKFAAPHMLKRTDRTNRTSGLLSAAEKIGCPLEKRKQPYVC
eukprot:COSAG01_NODE_5681_length_4104_cov_5.234707_2_plen_751_part_00